MRKVSFLSEFMRAQLKLEKKFKELRKNINTKIVTKYVLRTSDGIRFSFCLIALNA